MRSFEKKDHIIATATNLFYDHGYEAVGTAEICAVAQINRGSLYHFYDSKRDIYKSCLSRYTETVIEKINDITNRRLSPKNKLRALFFLEEPIDTGGSSTKKILRGCFLGNAIFEVSGLDDEIREYCQGLVTNATKTIETIIYGLSIDGYVEKSKTKPGAEIVWSIMQASAQLSKLRQTNEHAERFFKLTLHGLRAL